MVQSQKITPCLWFDNQAEEAANFYVSVFENSNIGRVVRYDDVSSQAAGQPEGTVLTIEFEIEGYQFLGLNAGPVFKFTPAVSFIVNCKTESEVEGLWKKLSDGNSNILMPLDKYPFSKKYGWIADKFGLSWQIILAEGSVPQKIMPSTLFVGDVAGKAEEAINFYMSVFKNAEVGSIFRYGPDQKPNKEGTVMFADFKLEGQWFATMDSAHDHKFGFNEAISFTVYCDTQEGIDYYWEKLSAVPQSEQCGWLKDKFGFSWQIVPRLLPDLLSDPDKEKSRNAMKAMLEMKKIDIDTIRKAVSLAPLAK